MLTSRLAAMTNPGRWGLTVIDSFFGRYRPRADQTLVVSGDLVRDREGHVHRFRYREGEKVFVTAV